MRLRRQVERFPHFIAKVGLTGEVAAYDSDGNVWVCMDEPLPGAEEWDNEIAWCLADGDNFEADVEPLPSGRFAHLDLD